MSQTVEFNPETAPLEQLEAYLSQPEPQQDDAVAVKPADDTGVEYVDLAQEAPEAAAPAEPVQAEQQPVSYTQEQLDAELGKRAKDVRKSIQESEEYKLGKMFLERRAKADNVSRKKAAELIREEYFNAEKERLSKDPAALAEAVLRSQMPRETAAEEAPQQEAPTHDTADARVQALASAVRESMQRGGLPQSFNVNECLEIYPDFFSDAKAFGEAAAVKIAEAHYRAAAAQQTARQVDARRAVSKSIAPRSQPAPAQRSVADMTDAEFAKFEQQIDRHANAGIHVRI